MIFKDAIIFPGMIWALKVAIEEGNLNLRNKKQNAEELEFQTSQINEWMEEKYSNQQFPMNISNDGSRVAYDEYLASSKTIAEHIL